MKKQLFFKSVIAILVMVCGLSCLTPASAQNRAISGTVVDQQGQPVIGASVMVVGNSRVGTVTNADGTFSLSVPNGATMSVSCIGYTTETFVVGQQQSYNITLSEDTEFLEETVVRGNGVERKRAGASAHR